MTSTVGLGYDLRDCGRCGALYDHDQADWSEQRCANCHGKDKKQRLNHATVVP